MKIDEAITLVENTIYKYRPDGKQLETWIWLLNLLYWYRSQDLIRRDWVLINRNCTHEECLKKNRDCNNCSYNVVEVKSILEIPKAGLKENE